MTDQIDNNQPTEANSQEQQDQPQLAIQKIYIKDASFEAPNLPEMFSVEYKPQIKMEMNSKTREVAENNYEVVLTVSVTSSVEEKTVFLVEVQQAGIFAITNVEDAQLQHALGVMGPETLYPYLRETIASLIGKAGFPAIQLAPVNFQALFMQQLQQAAAQAKESEQASDQTIQ